jgi:5-methylcytosine-specific restriction endonuclease McrA
LYKHYRAENKEGETMQSVLVLNATYQPLEVVSARRAIQLMLKGKATALDSSGRAMHSPAEAVDVPYVILLNYVIKQGKKKEPSFSRHGILARDNYSCVYCGKPADTIDHVWPQDKGGKSTWDNCVAACLSCNGKKGNKLLEQMGWTIPAKTFKKPNHMTKLLFMAKKNTDMMDAWRPYIAMYEPSVA